MNRIKDILAEVKDTLDEAISDTDRWFDKEEVLRVYLPENGGWSINQVLEHTVLTSHFLLILIEKGTLKALQLAQKKNSIEECENHIFHKDRLDEVGLHNSFTWIRPEHMEPKGDRSMGAIRAQLHVQHQQCLSCLERLKNGEGILYKTTMSVNNLGKIDVYEYIYFLAQHAKRHITQMEKIEQEYVSKGPKHG